MKLKLAVFKDPSWGTQFVLQGESQNGNVRVSEWIDVDFPELPENAVKAQYAALRIKKLEALRYERDQLLSQELAT